MSSFNLSGVGYVNESGTRQYNLAGLYLDDTTSTGAAVAIAGAISAHASTAGALGRSLEVSGSVASSSSVSGAMVRGLALGGPISAHGVLSGSVAGGGVLPLVGAVSASSGATAHLGKASKLAGSVQATFSVPSAALELLQGLQGMIASACDILGAIEWQAALSGVSESASTVDATLTVKPFTLAEPFIRIDARDRIFGVTPESRVYTGTVKRRQFMFTSGK